MPGHIPVCLFIQLSGLSVGRYDVTERKDYDWRVGSHQDLSCLTSTTCHPETDFFIPQSSISDFFLYLGLKNRLNGMEITYGISSFFYVAQLSQKIILMITISQLGLDLNIEK